MAKAATRASPIAIAPNQKAAWKSKNSAITLVAG
jgi:hypothetical protein